MTVRVLSKAGAALKTVSRLKGKTLKGGKEL